MKSLDGGRGGTWVRRSGDLVLLGVHDDGEDITLLEMRADEARALFQRGMLVAASPRSSLGRRLWQARLTRVARSNGRPGGVHPA